MSQAYDSIAITDLLPAVRPKIINRDDAASSFFIGDDSPSVTWPGQPWLDTTLNLLKVRNSTNSAWITLGSYATNLGSMPTTGGTMAADIAMGNQKITGLGAPAASTDMTRIDEADAGPATVAPINKGRQWLSHGDNVITLPNAQSNTSYVLIASIDYGTLGGVTARANPHTLPLELLVYNESVTRVRVRINGGYGFTSCGNAAAANVGTTEQYDDIANAWTARTAATSRRMPCGYSINGQGYSSCGYIAAPTGLTERFDNIGNAHTARTAVGTAKYSPNGFSLEGYGFAVGGYSGAGYSRVVERFDETANSQTAVGLLGIARSGPGSCSINNYGFAGGGSTTGGGYTQSIEKYDNSAGTWSNKTAVLGATKSDLCGYGLKGKGYFAGGYISAGADWSTANEEFDDVADTITAKAVITKRSLLGTFSLNGLGFICDGQGAGPANTGATERYDSSANTITARTAGSARYGPCGYATNEYFINYFSYNN